MAAAAPAEAAQLLGAANDKLGQNLVAKLSAPFLLARMPDWSSPKKRLLIYGQETAGWGGVSRCDVEGTLSHWVAKDREQAIIQLASSYAAFYSNPSVSSPFWAAHREALEILGEWSIAWSNLVRVDTSPLSARENWQSCSAWWNLSYDEVDAICDWQRALHLAELDALKPDAVLFLTGPHYDYCLRKTFGQFETVIFSGERARVVAGISAAGLPKTTFRTYHPNYLQRSGKWPLLTSVLAAIREQS